MAKYDVFISYSRLDTKIADRICEAFDAAGITYFIDRQGLSAGMEFPVVLANAIQNSRIFLFLASRNAYESKFTNSEITYAFNKKSKGEIIPYIIDGSTLPEHLQFVFSSINWRIRRHNDDRQLIFDIIQLSGKSVHTTPFQNISQPIHSSVFLFFVISIGLSIVYVLPWSRLCLEFLHINETTPFYFISIILLLLDIFSFYLLIKNKSILEANRTWDNWLLIIYFTVFLFFAFWLIDLITLPLFSFSFYNLIHAFYGDIEPPAYMVYSTIFICYSICFKKIQIRAFSNIHFDNFTTIGILLYSFLGIAYIATQLYIYGSFYLYLPVLISLITSYLCGLFSLISLKKGLCKK